MSRSRTRYDYLEIGSHGRQDVYNYNTSTHSITKGWSTCVDVVDPGDNHPFEVTSVSKDGCIINLRPLGSYYPWFYNYQADWIQGVSSVSDLVVSGIPEDVWFATNAAARTNPSRPYVDIPIDILDIRLGLQKLFEEAEMTAAQAASKGFLEYNFLYAPMISDIVKLLNLFEQINRRLEYLNKLYDTGVYKKTISYGTWKANSELQNIVVQSSDAYIQCNIPYETTVSVKAHCRWTLSPFAGPKPAPDDLRVLARSAALGLTVDFSTIWNLLPWTWLLDWFTDIGDVLIASRNLLPCQLDSVNIIKHTETIYRIPEVPITFTGWLGTSVGSMTSGTVTKSHKQRYPVSIFPSAQIEWLDATQTGILASLAAARR